MRWLLGNGWVMEPTASPLGPWEWQSRIKYYKKTVVPNNSLHLIRRLSELLHHIPISPRIELANGAPSSTPESADKQMERRRRATGLQTMDGVKCLLRWQRRWSAVRGVSNDSFLVVKNKDQQRKHLQDEARPPHRVAVAAERYGSDTRHPEKYEILITQIRQTSIRLYCQEAHLFHCLLWRWGNERKSFRVYVHPSAHFVMLSEGGVDMGWPTFK